ncbi:MAG: ABC transporter permease [Clostridia bacterium]|jgi:putative ABC transport system permease protein
MRATDAFQLAATNLSRRKARTILTTIGVVIGTAAIITMMSLGIGMEKNLTSQFEAFGNANDITVMPPIKMSGSSPFTTGVSSSVILDEEAVEELQEIPGVEGVVPSLSLTADVVTRVGRYETNMGIVGYDVESGPAVEEKMAEGKLFHKNTGMVMVLGYKVPDVFIDTRNRRANETTRGMTVNDNPQVSLYNDRDERVDVLHKTAKLTLSRVNDHGERETKTLRVKIVGVLEEKGNMEDYSIYMPMEEVAHLNDWAKRQNNTLKLQGYESVKVRVNSTGKVDQVVEGIADLGYTAFSYKQIVVQLSQIFAVIQAILGGIGAIALLVASIGIINTMTMAIYERTKEIGILKVVGASLGDIRNMFLLEAGTIGFLGGLIGLLFSYFIILMIDLFMGIYISSAGGGTEAQSILLLPPWLAVFAVVFSTFVGLLAGLYPAMKAARLSALNAIRTE